MSRGGEQGGVRGPSAPFGWMAHAWPDSGNPGVKNAGVLYRLGLGQHDDDTRRDGRPAARHRCEPIM